MGMNTLLDYHAQAAPGANTAFPSTALQALHSGRLEIAIALTAAAVVTIRVSRGGTSYDLVLNEGQPLSADTDYSFQRPCSEKSTYQFKISVDGILKVFQVNEVWDY